MDEASTQDVLRDLERVAFTSIPPLALSMALLFFALIFFNWLDLPEHAVKAVVTHDICVVIISTILWRVSEKRRIPGIERAAHPITAAMAFLLTSNVLTTLSLTAEPSYSNYILVIIIGSGTVMMSMRWLLFSIAGVMAAWLVVVHPVTTQQEFALLIFTMLSAIALSVATLTTRRRNHIRLMTLRRRDEQRQKELEKALNMAEEARRDLDRKVEERTSELSEANTELVWEVKERQRIEEERGALELQLRHAQKMESVGRLAGGVAHDFNNLLTVISGNLGLAMEGDQGVTAEEPRQLLVDAQQAAAKAASLTRKLLAFSRRQILEPQVIEPALLLKELERILERIVGEHITLDLQIAPQAGRIHADPGQVEQVLVNLVINARDAMKESGGALTLTITRVSCVHPSDPDAAAQEWVRFSVRDEGHGIDPETLEHIFDPFFSTKKQGDGTGLGLAMVDGIVNQHGGWIEVDSQREQGTTFHIHFPCVDAPLTPQKAAPQTAPHGTERILVVEDERLVRKLATRVLRRLGYDVLAAENGLQALELINAQEQPIDMLLTDVVMPEMGGKELTAHLRRDHPHIRVLFASGYDQEVIDAGGILPEDVDFIGKPYTFEELALKVREVLDHK